MDSLCTGKICWRKSSRTVRQYGDYVGHGRHGSVLESISLEHRTVGMSTLDARLSESNCHEAQKITRYIYIDDRSNVDHDVDHVQLERPRKTMN